MITNPHQHLYAEFTPSGDRGSFPAGSTPVIAWNDEGAAMVAHPKTGSLSLAAAYPNFDGLTWAALAVQAAFPAPPGYTVTDIDETPLPVVGFAVVTGDRGVHPLFINKVGDVLLEPDVVVTPPATVEQPVRN
ncbi:hypothetical protein AB0H36_27900 [Kribbella sp. NPDC050820]|uniref:hypothetical protein n=1 Tax=Kribbella sp. NPDC050820 TaxID=3155408 RepID=UPI0033D63C0A